MRSLRWTLGAFLLLAALAGCATWQPKDVQTVGFWALGWHYTATQNRIQRAIPPVIDFLRPRYPDIRAVEPPKDLGRDFRAAVLNAPARLQRHLDRRMVAAMTVTGLPCAAESFPVRDGKETVAAFFLLDVTALAKPPAEWRPCGPVAPPGAGEDRVAALRALLSGLMDAAVKR